MTQPQAPPQQPPSNNGPIIAGAAVGLALIAIEARVQQQVEDDVEQALAAITVLLLLGIAAGVISGTELLSRKDVATGTRRAWDTAKASSRTTVNAGYEAASQLALTRAQRDMQAVGHEVPSTLPDLGGTLDQILRDVDTAYGHAETDLGNTVRDAFDGVSGPDAEAARKLVVAKAVEQAGNRLSQRLGAAAATAVHQGSSDTQQAIWDEFTMINPYVKVVKVWRVTAADPCGMCAALDGTRVAVRDEFDYQAGADTKDFRTVWRNLLGPPRHPHCRCQLELVTT